MPGGECRLASSDGALRSLGAGRPRAGVMTGAGWLVGAVCWLRPSACLPFPPFPLGGIQTRFLSNRTPSTTPRPDNSRLVSPLLFSSKYSQSHPGRSGESLQGRASFISLAWSKTPQPWYRELSPPLPPPLAPGTLSSNHTELRIGQGALTGGGNCGRIVSLTVAGAHSRGFKGAHTHTRGTTVHQRSLRRRDGVARFR